MKTLLTILIAFFTFSIVAGQTTITGRVTEANGKALPFANIYLDVTYDGTSSNAEGYFSLKTNEKGTQTLKVVFLGFAPYAKIVELKGDTLQIQVTLKELFNELNAVTITAGTFEASDKKKAAP